MSSNKAVKHIPRNSPEEDARIRAAAEADPDNPPRNTSQMRGLRPFREIQAERRRGRPKAETTKEPVSVRLDPEIVAYFRETGIGWQTRLNDVLADYVKRQRAQT
jgi:uncharacterized protein (DUF4415 family)